MKESTCKHFRGVQHDTCAVGVDMASMRDVSGEGMARWPCLPGERPCATTCGKFQAPTAEEIEADKARIAALVAKAVAGERSGAVCVLTTGETRNPIGKAAPLDMMIAIGFGSAVVTRDGRTVLDGETCHDHWLTVKDAERLAERTGRARRRQRERRVHDWRISIHGPLWDAEWQRQRPGKWICVRAGQGFA